MALSGGGDHFMDCAVGITHRVLEITKSLSFERVRQFAHGRQRSVGADFPFKTAMRRLFALCAEELGRITVHIPQRILYAVTVLGIAIAAEQALEDGDGGGV